LSPSQQARPRSSSRKLASSRRDSRRTCSASLPPILFLVFALWLAEGAPRQLIRTTGCAFALLCLLLLAPWNRLVSVNALPDSFSVALLLKLHARPDTVLSVAAPIALAIAVLIPRRFVAVLPAVVALVLVTTSVYASNEIAANAATAQAKIVGPSPDWIDRAGSGPVTYVYANEAYWNTVWFEQFWNRRIKHVVALAPSRVPGPMLQRQVSPGSDGRLAVLDRYIVASDRLTFFGSPIAHLAQSGLDVSGLTLWELDGQARLSTVEHNVLPNGDMVGPATVDVYDCRTGSLDLTLLPKATNDLTISFDGLPVRHVRIGGLQVWHGSIPAPPSSTPRLCRFTIAGGTLLGSTRIAFVR
jgi:hypothetical protein